MTSLSTHVLDTERGAPAEGVFVSLFQTDRLVARGETNADGRIASLGSSLDPDVYRLVFDVGAYFKSRGRTDPFLERVTIEFRVAAAAGHYHVPLLLSPYACTSYRGS